MSIQVYKSVAEIFHNLPVVYFQNGYLQSQDYAHLGLYTNEDYFIAFDIADEKAISIPRSPFGSVCRRKMNADSCKSFLELVQAALKKDGIRQLEIHHPSQIYQSFVPSDQLASLGFNTVYSDINQHIELSDEWPSSIHKMQQRKLQALIDEGFEFRKMDASELETAYKFLNVCRQAQGLQINISWELLNRLSDLLPNVYESFGVFREGKISALCITVNATPDIAYYYLPATSPLFRDKSPMVLLIAGMVDYYQRKGMKYLDLGVSSFQGKPQETLRIFKERMGAMETPKHTFTKSL